MTRWNRARAAFDRLRVWAEAIDGTCSDQRTGLTFWLMRKALFGSYMAFARASLS